MCTVHTLLRASYDHGCRPEISCARKLHVKNTPHAIFQKIGLREEWQVDRLLFDLQPSHAPQVFNRDAELLGKLASPIK